MSNNYVILTDSCADLTPQLTESLDLTVIPMEFHFGDNESYLNYPDGRDMSSEDFYDRVRQGAMPTTSQVTAARFAETARPCLQAGQDLLFLIFSSALSGTCQSAMLAVSELREQFPERKILAVDTLAASMGQGLLVYHAARLRQQGADIETAARWVEEHRLRLAHWFTVDDLNHLKRGGRVSAVAAVVGTALQIKPILHVDDAGRLIPREKVRGRRKSIEALARHLAETMDPAEPPQTVFISHGDCPEDARTLAGLVGQNPRVKETVINQIGPVIGAHSGPGTLAVFFLATHR